MILLYLQLRLWWEVLVAQPDSHLMSQCKLRMSNINSRFHSGRVFNQIIGFIVGRPPIKFGMPPGMHPFY